MIRVFVGTDCNHCDAESQAVLEWSIRKKASEPVEIVWMKLSRDPSSFWFSDGNGGGWNTSDWTTTFSALRWAIPAYCGYEGRAIYMDSDVVVTADIAELWRQPIPAGKCLLAKGGGSWRLCVSMWDCAAAKGFVLPIDQLRSNPAAHTLMTRKLVTSNVAAPFNGAWNCLDCEDFEDLDDPKLKAIHYTAIASQVHLPLAIERLKEQGRSHWFNGKVVRHHREDLIALFDRLLREATEAGYGVDRYTTDEPFGVVRKKSLENYHRSSRAMA